MNQWSPQWFSFIQKQKLLEQVKIGFPAAIQMISECSAFCVAGLIIGKFGEVAMSAHQIALTFSGVVFMMPCGLSHALAVRIGNAYGAKDFSAIHHIAKNGWQLALIMALFNATLLILLGKEIAAVFHQNKDVQSLTVSLFSIVAVFQVFDAMQVSTAGILRGLKETTTPAIIGFVSYWIIGVPVGYFLSLSEKLKAQGMWWGLALGLAMAALFLFPFCKKKIRAL